MNHLAPASPPKRELKLENGDDSGKDAAKTEDNSEVKAEANGDENIQTDEAGNKLEASDEAQVKIEGAAEGEPAKAAKADEEAQPAQEDDAKKTEDDQVLIPAAPTTLFIKSVSPEISRADLEKVGASYVCTVYDLFIYTCVDASTALLSSRWIALYCPVGTQSFKTLPSVRMGCLQA